MKAPAQGGAGSTKRARRAGTGRTAAGQPRLSQLLVLTMLAMALLLCIRVPSTLRVMVGGEFAAAESGEAVAALIEPAAGPASPATAPADPTTMTAVQELAAELARREQAIVRREQAASVQEAALALVEQRIQQQNGELDALRAAAEALVDKVAAEDAARAAQLARVYEAMKPRNAAAILEQLGLELLLPIVKGMRDAKVSAIVAAMSPDKARELTAELARKRAAALPQ